MLAMKWSKKKSHKKPSVPDVVDLNSLVTSKPADKANPAKKAKHDEADHGPHGALLDVLFTKKDKATATYATFTGESGVGGIGDLAAETDNFVFASTRLRLLQPLPDKRPLSAPKLCIHTLKTLKSEDGDDNSISTSYSIETSYTVESYYSIGPRIERESLAVLLSVVGQGSKAHSTWCKEIAELILDWEEKTPVRQENGNNFIEQTK